MLLVYLAAALVLTLVFLYVRFLKWQREFPNENATFLKGSTIEFLKAKREGRIMELLVRAPLQGKNVKFPFSDNCLLSLFRALSHFLASPNGFNLLHLLF